MDNQEREYSHEIETKGNDLTVHENDMKITKRATLSMLGHQATLKYGEDNELEAKIYGFDVRVKLEGDTPNDDMSFTIKMNDIAHIILDAIEKRYGKPLSEIKKGERPA